MGQSSLGMRSVTPIIKGKDLETSNPPQTHHPNVHLLLCVANLHCVCISAVVHLPFHVISVFGCASERVCMHVHISEASSEC